LNVPNTQEQIPDVGDAYRAIADGTPLPWKDLEATLTDADEAEALHLLDDIATAYRTNATAAAPPRGNILFRWGVLEAELLLGSGSYGDVYRAFDPWLGRHVALKLFRDDAGSGLEEARRLARLRHRNVLSVYGCGIHDGRAGLWSELVEGRTLAAAVAAEGAFSSKETLRVGRDLAQALTVVHAAGLVHGDVKAENVMREGGGRMVLMDFGAGGDARLLAGQRLISGTPRYLPPEVLDGAPLNIASDVYAFGVLLYFLLSGRLPYAATDARALREEQRGDTRPALHTLRPDSDPALCALVESCLANDPTQRPADAQALVAKFTHLLHPATRLPSRRLPIAALVTACAALAAVATIAIWPHLSPSAWSSEVKFLRVAGNGDIELPANISLKVGDRLRLSLRSSRDAYVYVLNEDSAGNATVLFPLGRAAQNPQRGGATLTLPGGEGSTLAWEVTAESTREEFVVISSLTPLTVLDDELSNWSHAHVTDDTRAVGGIVDTPAVQVQGERLRRILVGLDQDREHVRVWQYTFAHTTEP
jgi:serine/threonine protein kinase